MTNDINNTTIYILENYELTQVYQEPNKEEYEVENTLDIDGRREITYKKNGTDEGGNCEEEDDEEEVPYCYANGKYSAPIPCGCSQPCCVPDSDDEEEKPKCKSCGVERVVDYEDNICHTCYHKSCDEGECYCCDNEEKPKEEEKPKIVIIKKKKKKAKKLIIKA